MNSLGIEESPNVSYNFRAKNSRGLRKKYKAKKAIGSLKKALNHLEPLVSEGGT